MKKLLAVDLDGTLFHPKRSLTLMTRKNYKFLKDFIAQGNEVVLATGRNSMMLPKLEKKLGCTLTLIGCNGGFTMRDGKLLDSHPLEQEKCSSMFVDLKDEFQVMAWTAMDCGQNDYIYFRDGIEPFMVPIVKIYYFFKFKYRELTIMNKNTFTNKLKEGSIYKIMSMYGTGKKAMEKALLATLPLKEKYGEWFNLANSKTVIEVTDKKASKGLAVLKYALDNGYDINDVYCVGDSENDISMFKNFPHSFAMNNAQDWVKEHAAHVVNSVSDMKEYIDNPKLCKKDIEFFNEHRNDPIKPR